MNPLPFAGVALSRARLAVCFSVLLRSRPWSWLALALVWSAGVVTSWAQTIPNPSFEANAVFTNPPGYLTGNNAFITGWTTNHPDSVGLNPGVFGANNSPIADNGAIPQGARVAFLESEPGETVTLATTISGLKPGTWYRIQFGVNRSQVGSSPNPSYRVNGGPSVTFALPLAAGGANPYFTINAIFQATSATAALEVSNSLPASAGSSAALLVDHFRISASPAAIVVNKTVDDNTAGTLRKALADAQAAPGFNLITFAPTLSGATITLGSSITINDPEGVVVDGSTLANAVKIVPSGTGIRMFFNAVGSNCTLRKLSVENADISPEAGAVLNEGLLDLSLCTFKNNQADGVGGAVFNSAQLIATNCQFIDNKSAIAAGALLHLGMSLYVRGCTFSGNTANSFGGAVYTIAPGAHLESCTFSGNSSANAGGALYADQMAVVTLNHCTLAGNTSSNGGGIANHGKVTVKNTIIADNTATASGTTSDVENNGSIAATFTREGANIIEAYANTSGGTDSGPAAITTDPQLAALASNGGPTQTRAIADDSVARNAAVDSNATVDQRGSIVQGTPDIGAYELQNDSTFLLSATTSSGFEGGVADVVIQRTGGISGTSTVRLFTTPGAGATGATTSDFTARANTTVSDVTFLDGETAKTVAIPLTADLLTEADETFTVTVGSPSPSGATVGTPATATVTIKNALAVSNTADTGAGSLREVLATAAGSAGPDVIGFTTALTGRTIVLGSALLVSDAGGVTIDASSIGGLTIDGGAGENRILTIGGGNSVVTLKRLTFTGAGAATISGGAILLNTGCTANLIDCTLTGNTGANGGAINNSNGALTLTRCTLFNNNAIRGGGIYSNTVTGDTTFKTSLERCTISGNVADAAGGGIQNFNGTTTLLHCTITKNTAPATFGAGVSSYGDTNATTIVDKSIIAGNLTGGDLDLDSSMDAISVTTMGGNVIGTGSAIGNFNMSLGDAISVSAADLKLGDLADNGGPTQTHALQAGSPALNRATSSTSTGDQRGFMINGIADSGAYEMQPGGAFSLSQNVYSVSEGDALTVTVTRLDSTIGSATVRVYTVPITATSADFSPRSDSAASGVTFANGETSKQVVLATTPDSLPETNEIFSVVLGSPTPQPLATLDSPSIATVTIVEPLLVANSNDDGPGSLRRSVAAAAANPGADTITFAPGMNGQTITLGSDIVIDDDAKLTVDASNLPLGLTIDAGPGDNRIFTIGEDADLTLKRVTLKGGDGNGEKGGAILTEGALTALQCTFTGNLSTSEGGAIYLASTGSANLQRCTLSGNSASMEGGAVHVSQGAAANLVQCTLSGNIAGNNGGAIANVNDGEVDLLHCTLSQNQSYGLAGGVYNGANARTSISRSIIFGNSATGTPASGDLYNLVTGTVTRVNTSFAALVDNQGTFDGAGTFDGTDPKLLPLAANGGVTATHALQPGSPAIDHSSGSSITSDQRGLPIINGPDTGAYEAQLGGIFILEKTGYTCEEGNGATIRILRTGGAQGTATVRLITVNGTAKSGDALDYDARPNTTASDVLFNIGESFKDVDVFSNIDGLVEANESFTVALGSPSTGAAIGTPGSANVSIKDPSAGSTATDNVKPKVTITSPAAMAAINVDVGGTLTVTGTATDNKGVQHVSVFLNGSNYGNADLEKPFAVATQFTKILGPGGIQTGLNTLEIVVGDGAGNELNPGLKRTFKVFRPLLVNISGHGNVTPAGVVQKSYREVGKPVTLTAVPGMGSIFAGWEVLSNHSPASLGITPFAIDLPVLTVIHREDLVLRAHFVISPFTSDVVGIYDGGIESVSLIGPAADTEGYASFGVASTGSFTGKLTLEGVVIPITGNFDDCGCAYFGPNRSGSLTIVRKGKSSLNLTLDIDFPSGVIYGQILFLDGSPRGSEIFAQRAVFNAGNPVPPDLLGPNGADGVFTTMFSPVDNSPDYEESAYPQGYGVGAWKLTQYGKLTFSGVLPDGTGVSASTTLSASMDWRFYASLYKGKGLVAGWPEILSGHTTFDFDALDCVWFRPAQDVQHYPAGWPNGLFINMEGALYKALAGASVVPGLPGTGAATLEFTKGLLGPPQSRTVTISAADLVANTSGDAGFTMKIDRKTGLYSGTFTHTDGTKPKFQGVILNKDGTNQCPGFFLTTSPKVKDYTGQSGAVDLLR